MRNIVEHLSNCTTNKTLQPISEDTVETSHVRAVSLANSDAHLWRRRIGADDVERSYPQVAVDRDVSFEEIWTLFLESGFLYPEKVERLGSALPEVHRTVRALLAANGDLLATVVLRIDGVPQAHLSALLSHEHTWTIQHLAALPLTARRLDGSARVTLALAYYIQLRPDIRWLKMFYRPNNIWPSRVFGGFASRIHDPMSSDLRTFHYMVAPTSSPTAPLTTDVHVRTGGEIDFCLIEEWFLLRGRFAELMANNLHRTQIRLDAVSDHFSSLGLDRHREPLVAERNGRVTGFALLDVSSLGMNFSELTNSFTIHLVEADAESRHALIAAAQQRYADLNRPQCIALVEDDDLSPFIAAGFVKVKDYTCWTFHRSHMAALEEYFITLFGARRRGNGGT
jgi:hypothetical protein